MSDQNAPGGPAAPETTSIQVLADLVAQQREHKLSTEELSAVAALPPGSALLVAHDGAGAGSRFLLDEDLVQAGRHPDRDIYLDDVTVSRTHAEFVRSGTSFEIRDCDSLNGTYVNSDRVDSAPLRNGDDVQIGKFRFTFYLNTAAQA